MFDRSLLCGDVVKRSNVEGGQREFKSAKRGLILFVKLLARSKL